MIKHTVVLVSGGIDSAATIAVCKEASAEVSGVFVDYGQPAAQSEWDAAQRVAHYYGVSVKKINLGVKLQSTDGEFFGRNTLLVLIAAGIMNVRQMAIAIGIHALSDYYDTTPLFARHIQRILDGYSGGSITLRTPFLTDTKSDIIRFAEKNGVPLRLTYSCERQNAPPCGQCPSCQDRRDLDAE